MAFEFRLKPILIRTHLVYYFAYDPKLYSAPNRTLITMPIKSYSFITLRQLTIYQTFFITRVNIAFRYKQLYSNTIPQLLISNYINVAESRKINIGLGILNNLLMSF